MNAPTDLATATEERVLLRSVAEGVATLTLNRPKHYNALSGAAHRTAGRARIDRA